VKLIGVETVEGLDTYTVAESRASRVSYQIRVGMVVYLYEVLEGGSPVRIGAIPLFLLPSILEALSLSKGELGPYQGVFQGDPQGPEYGYDLLVSVVEREVELWHNLGGYLAAERWHYPSDSDWDPEVYQYVVSHYHLDLTEQERQLRRSHENAYSPEAITRAIVEVVSRARGQA
jgi:hypothetical protein